MAALDLYPTKTRLRYLRLVEAGVVRYDPATSRAYDGVGGETLTDATREAERAGWVSVERVADEPAPVLLTVLGADVLAAADRC